jgi:spore germination cell wall hydrolase CwlJ-like protein
MEIADRQGFSETEITCIANAFYAECEGNNVSYDDCVD